MVAERRIVSIIPARFGSKGLPRKNIKLLAGKPLIAYSIEAALESKTIEKIVISTDDRQVMDISNSYGVEVIKRPKELSRDESPTINVIFHALEVLKTENYKTDVILLLQPTSPLRTAEDIDDSIRLYLESHCESVISVCEFEHSPYWSFKIEGGYLRPLFGAEALKRRRQDLEMAYVPNGALFISIPENLRKYDGFYCPGTIPYIMPPERSIDIDNEVDFLLVELLMKQNIKAKGEDENNKFDNI